MLTKFIFTYITFFYILLLALSIFHYLFFFSFFLIASLASIFLGFCSTTYFYSCLDALILALTNLIYNLKSYLSSAQGAEKVDDRLVESKNKIASFIEKPSNDDVLLSNTNGISSIENGNIYEYNNSSLVKKISTTIHTTADSQTDLNTLQFNTLFQYSKSKQIANYIYILLYYFGKA